MSTSTRPTPARRSLPDIRACAVYCIRLFYVVPPALLCHTPPYAIDPPDIVYTPHILIIRSVDIHISPLHVQQPLSMLFGEPPCLLLAPLPPP